MSEEEQYLQRIEKQRQDREEIAAKLLELEEKIKQIPDPANYIEYQENIRPIEEIPQEQENSSPQVYIRSYEELLDDKEHIRNPPSQLSSDLMTIPLILDKTNHKSVHPFSGPNTPQKALSKSQTFKSPLRTSSLLASSTETVKSSTQVSSSLLDETETWRSDPFCVAVLQPENPSLTPIEEERTEKLEKSLRRGSTPSYLPYDSSHRSAYTSNETTTQSSTRSPIALARSSLEVPNTPSKSKKRQEERPTPSRRRFRGRSQLIRQGGANASYTPQQQQTEQEQAVPIYFAFFGAEEAQRVKEAEKQQKYAKMDAEGTRGMHTSEPDEDGIIEESLTPTQQRRYLSSSSSSSPLASMPSSSSLITSPYSSSTPSSSSSFASSPPSYSTPPPPLPPSIQQFDILLNGQRNLLKYPSRQERKEQHRKTKAAIAASSLKNKQNTPQTASSSSSSTSTSTSSSSSSSNATPSPYKSKSSPLHSGTHTPVRPSSPNQNPLSAPLSTPQQPITEHSSFESYPLSSSTQRSQGQNQTPVSSSASASASASSSSTGSASASASDSALDSTSPASEPSSPESQTSPDMEQFKRNVIASSSTSSSSGYQTGSLRRHLTVEDVIDEVDEEASRTSNSSNEDYTAPSSALPSSSSSSTSSSTSLSTSDSSASVASASQMPSSLNESDTTTALAAEQASYPATPAEEHSNWQYQTPVPSVEATFVPDTSSNNSSTSSFASSYAYSASQLSQVPQPIIVPHTDESPNESNSASGFPRDQTSRSPAGAPLGTQLPSTSPSNSISPMSSSHNWAVSSISPSTGTQAGLGSPASRLRMSTTSAEMPNPPTYGVSPLSHSNSFSGQQNEPPADDAEAMWEEPQSPREARRMKEKTIGIHSAILRSVGVLTGSIYSKTNKKEGGNGQGAAGNGGAGETTKSRRGTVDILGATSASASTSTTIQTASGEDRDARKGTDAVPEEENILLTTLKEVTQKQGRDGMMQTASGTRSGTGRLSTSINGGATDRSSLAGGATGMSANSTGSSMLQTKKGKKSKLLSYLKEDGGFQHPPSPATALARAILAEYAKEEEKFEKEQEKEREEEERERERLRKEGQDAEMNGMAAVDGMYGEAYGYGDAFEFEASGAPKEKQRMAMTSEQSLLGWLNEDRAQRVMSPAALKVILSSAQKKKEEEQRMTADGQRKPSAMTAPAALHFEEDREEGEGEGEVAEEELRNEKGAMMNGEEGNVQGDAVRGEEEVQMEEGNENENWEGEQKPADNQEEYYDPHQQQQQQQEQQEEQEQQVNEREKEISAEEEAANAEEGQGYNSGMDEMGQTQQTYGHSFEETEEAAAAAAMAQRRQSASAQQVPLSKAEQEKLKKEEERRARDERLKRREMERQRRVQEVQKMAKKGRWGLSVRHQKPTPPSELSIRISKLQEKREAAEAQEILSGQVPSRILMLMSRAETRDSLALRPATFSPQKLCRHEGVERTRKLLTGRTLSMLAAGTTPEDLALQESADPEGTKLGGSAL